MSKQIVVLGMHRAGTSLIAHLLIKLGVSMGTDLIEPDKENPGGYFEDKDFVRMNERILTDAGGSWWQPPKDSAIESAAAKVSRKIKYVISYKETRGGDFWGWKDPRTSLTAFIYHPLLTNPYYVIVERHPQEIARSIMQREKTRDLNGNISKEFFVLLAGYYYNRIDYFTKNKNRVWVNYNELTGDRFRARDILEGLCYDLGLDTLLLPGAFEVIKFR